MKAVNGERLAVLVGLVLAMLAAVPGYYLIGDRERLLLIGAGAVAVAMATLMMWRHSSEAERRRFYRALSRLPIAMVLGLAVALLGHIMGNAGTLTGGWYRWLPWGMTTGVVLQALWCWWRPLTVQ
ncbi:hypothetical protein [Kushneria aurantia]|uniref:Uncharacterized protein n=1 Tax=Kushneria aurantia TaxID=504092 RepID=A0ABV6G471_9GAMM|nr:hypothetical protein [Kushneria aurantia]